MVLYYFAYGSNMSHMQMKKRCPSAVFLKRAKLDGYKFVYGGFSQRRKGAVGNVVIDKAGVVWGALFEINKECVKNLDTYEGCPNSYQRIKINVYYDNGKKYKAFVYLKEPRKIGSPSSEYRRTVVEGARDCFLPKDYIERFLW